MVFNVLFCWLLILTASQPIGLSLISSIVPTSSTNITTEEFVEKHNELKAPVTIEQKYLDGAYRKNIHDLYHDLKLATTYQLVHLPIGSAKYKEIFSFFRFIADLIIREGNRLGLLGLDAEKTAKDKGFESEVFNGYRKIVSDIKEWFGESYFIVSQNSGPLFTSINGKASIDPRDTETHGQFNTTRLVPQVNNHITPYQLGFVSPSIASVPHPSVPPTEILRDFVHPTKGALPSTKWIKFDSYSSFAPVMDNGSAVFGDIITGSLLYDRTAKESEKTDKSKDVNEENADVSMENAKNEENNVKEEEEIDPNEEIDLVSVFQWKPGNEITEEELEAHENGEINSYISKLLLQLQFLQNLRLSSNDGSEFVIGQKEREIFHQIQNIITRIAADYTPKELDLQVSSNIPIPLVNYQGTLPGTDRSIQPQARLTNMARTQARGTKMRR